MTIEESNAALLVACKYVNGVGLARFGSDVTLKCITFDGECWTLVVHLKSQYEIQSSDKELKIDMKKQEVLSMKDVSTPEPTVEHHHHAAPYVPMRKRPEDPMAKFKPRGAA